MIRQTLDVGVTLIDTADVYGPYTNEELDSHWASAVLVPTRRAEDGGLWRSSQQGLPICSIGFRADYDIETFKIRRRGDWLTVIGRPSRRSCPTRWR